MIGDDVAERRLTSATPVPGRAIANAQTDGRRLPDERQITGHARARMEMERKGSSFFFYLREGEKERGK